MNRTTAVVRLASAALMVAGLHSAAGAQVEPFKLMPADAAMVVRVDFAGLAANPAIKPALDDLAMTQPDWKAAAFASSGDAGMTALSKGFPGDIVVFEMGLKFGSDFQAGPSGGYALVQGQLQGAEIMNRLQANGWSGAGEHKGLTIFGNAAKDSFMTMPNAWTMALCQSVEDVKAVIDTSTGGAPAVTGFASAKTDMLRTVGTAPVAFAMDFPPEMRAKIAEGAQMPELMMIAGLPALAKEMGNASAAGLFLGSSATGIQFNLGATFVDDAAAGRAVEALNQVIPAAAAMQQMMAAQMQDQEGIKKAQEFGALKAGMNGNRVFLSIPMANEDVAKMIQQGQMAAQMAAAQAASSGAPAAPAAAPAPAAP